MNMKTFVNRHHIRIQSDWAHSNPGMPDWRDATHFKCRLRMGNRQMTVYFSQGYAHTGEPKVHDVLDCLASDSASIENARSFKDWASDLGYDTGSRMAERTLKACEKTAAKLKAFLGDDLYETLLWKTEREQCRI